jgi:hypothetical protein
MDYFRLATIRAEPLGQKRFAVVGESPFSAWEGALLFCLRRSANILTG